jgi:CDP-diacylglycerol--glycerol-3-phosphate 3-phosphatidyltransferase
LQSLIILIIFLIGAFSDLLDGHIARKRNLITNFGKFADPLADKMLVLTVLVLMVSEHYLEPWVLIIILAREMTVTGFRVVAASHNLVIAASTLGKVKTNFQFALVIMLLVFGGTTIPWIQVFLQILIYATALLTIVSGAEYILKNKHVLK